VKTPDGPVFNFSYGPLKGEMRGSVSSCYVEIDGLPLKSISCFCTGIREDALEDFCERVFLYLEETMANYPTSKSALKN
jgi:hypothetical protein